MEVKLWNELNDQQAEKVSGGQGIGQLVSGVNQIAKDQVRAFGYDNVTQALKDGVIIVNEAGVNGFPYGSFVSDYVDYYLKG